MNLIHTKIKLFNGLYRVLVLFFEEALMMRTVLANFGLLSIFGMGLLTVSQSSVFALFGCYFYFIGR